MAMLYFLGGENVSKRDARGINALAFEEAGGSPSVLVFSWARPSFDVRFRRRKMLVDYFRCLGASGVEFAEFSDSFGAVASEIAQSDLIYLTGGQVSVLLSRLRSSGVDKLLKSYHGIIVGRSAGAMVLGKSCLVKNRYSGNRKTAAGLGLTEFSVKAHYDLSSDNLLKEASNNEKVYGVPQGSAIVWNNGLLSFLGEVVLFDGGKKSAARSLQE